MTQDASGKKQDKPRGAHGSPSEVSWEHVKGTEDGRQPYANRGKREAAPATGSDGVSEGDRGEMSGRNLDQLEAVKGLPASDDVKQHQQHDDDGGNTE